MVPNINLSYVLTTFNKLPYLEVVIDNLIINCKEDEEIVVTDGGSTDGTKEFLTTLYAEGKIHQFISEKDLGEAHGFNKGILMASGHIIKLITDDDVFNHNVIQNCKDYLLKNDEIDVLVCNMFHISEYVEDQKKNSLIFAKNYEIWFESWANKDVKNTFFCGIPMFLRRSSLPQLGLLDTSLKFIDFEYSIRVSSNNANIIFYKPVIACAFINLQSNSTKYKDILLKEVDRVSKYHNFQFLFGEKKDKTKDKINFIFKKLKINYQFKKDSYPDNNVNFKEIPNEGSLKETFRSINNQIDLYNESLYSNMADNQNESLYIKTKK